MSSEAAGIVAKIASAQHGVAAARQLLGAGLTYKDIEREMRHGVIEVLFRGIYRSAHWPESWQQLLLGACLSYGDEAAGSHATAARVWGLKIPDRWIVELTVPFSGNGRSCHSRIKVHRSRRCSSTNRTRHDGFPVTTVTRTLLDLAPSLGRHQLARMLDDAFVRGLSSPRRLMRALPEPGSVQPAGTPKLRAALEIWETTPKLDSVAEADFLRLVVDAGLPRPKAHYVLRDGDEVVAELDFAWPNDLLAVEVDGYRFHAGPKAHAEDYVRAKRIHLLGWHIVRTTPYEMARHDDVLIAELRLRLGLGDSRRPA